MDKNVSIVLYSVPNSAFQSATDFTLYGICENANQTQNEPKEFDKNKTDTTMTTRTGQHGWDSIRKSHSLNKTPTTAKSLQHTRLTVL